MNEKPVMLSIVGGGAAGMFAAAVAAERRIPCVLIERKARLGSKVLLTANGRCIFTKDLSPEQFLADIGPARAFVAEAVRECPPRKIISGLKALGVPLRRMPDGRMFPADGKATTIVHAFGDFLRDAQLPLLTNCPVTGIERENAKARGEGEGEGRRAPFILHTANFDLRAENVLLATGGVSYPKTGSVGDGQNFARALGHRIVPYRPGLIGLETSDPHVTKLAGRRFEEDGRVKVFAPPTVHGAGPRLLFDYTGEVDCEQFGLSGAAIYNAQRFLEHYDRGDNAGTIPTPSAATNRPSAKDLRREVWFGHNRLQFSNLAPRPVKEAIVTIGGVSTDEIDPHTMESRLCPGIYFAGEVMDIDGPTGGYNLTLAFATARKAVLAAASSRR